MNSFIQFLFFTRVGIYVSREKFMVFNLGSKIKQKKQKYCGRYADSLLIHDKSSINKVSKGWYIYSPAYSDS